MRLALLILPLLVPAIAQSTEARIALVIGGSNYANGSLPNRANDGAALRSRSSAQLSGRACTKRTALIDPSVPPITG
jgi:hypothetical protein